MLYIIIFWKSSWLQIMLLICHALVKHLGEEKTYGKELVLYYHEFASSMILLAQTHLNVEKEVYSL